MDHRYSTLVLGFMGLLVACSETSSGPTEYTLAKERSLMEFDDDELSQLCAERRAHRDALVQTHQDFVCKTYVALVYEDECETEYTACLERESDADWLRPDHCGAVVRIADATIADLEACEKAEWARMDVEAGLFPGCGESGQLDEAEGTRLNAALDRQDSACEVFDAARRQANQGSNCESGFFLIGEEAVCDGVVDCFNAEDETDC